MITSTIDLLAACPPMPGDWPVPADAPPIPDSPLPRIRAELEKTPHRWELFRQLIDWPGDLREKNLAAAPELRPHWEEYCKWSKANTLALNLRGLHRRADWLRTWLEIAFPRVCLLEVIREEQLAAVRAESVELLGLLREVYSHVGNHRPDTIRHVLPSHLRDVIRDKIGAEV